MSFSADWLALRGAADERARNGDLSRRLRQWFERHRTVHVLDLGSGTGANMRGCRALLPRSQCWRLVDNDSDLLSHAEAPESVVFEKVVADLSGDLSPLFKPAPDLVTASAFFDLVGREVVNRIVAATVEAGAVFYAVLTYDGREEWEPAHALDRDVLAAFHEDQRRDKGLGVALGPDAAQYLAHTLRDAGYTVEIGESDWHLETPEDSGLIAALANGSADAVVPVVGPESAQKWRDARKEALRVLVGHRDLLAFPPQAH